LGRALKAVLGYRLRVHLPSPLQEHDDREQFRQKYLEEKHEDTNHLSRVDKEGARFRLVKMGDDPNPMRPLNGTINYVVDPVV